MRAGAVILARLRHMSAALCRGLTAIDSQERVELRYTKPQGGAGHAEGH